jgi:integrase/recombinase XerD
MNRLRKMMLEELQRRNFSEDTIRHYHPHSRRLCSTLQPSAGSLGPRHIREYQAQLFQKRKLSSGSVTNHLKGHTLFLHQDAQERLERRRDSLSEKELIDAAGTPFHRTLLLALYATSPRCAEVTHM